MALIDRIFAARGLDDKSRAAFLSPDYSKLHNPFLLPDMEKAVDRIIMAYKNQEKVAIYGDYDIDGLTATALLKESLENFGLNSVEATIPSRFTEGYGLTIDAVERFALNGFNLLITVDCGSQSEKEISLANELGLDVIVTDHHNLPDVLPPAIAVINPKRSDCIYPFRDLAGVGVAFKLVQALQTRLDGIAAGSEKWLLDLVALGTVCDVVELVDENRTYVSWGLKVLGKTRRPGLKALMAIAKIESNKVNSRALGFGLGPRMNAAGRLETAQHALNILIRTDTMDAYEKAEYLDDLNISRRADQAKILKAAIAQAETMVDDPVLVVSGQNWNHGIVGIVASKLLEKYKKPVFVLDEMGEETKGSARSYGDFSVADALKFAKKTITKGGGHKLAAGVTLPTKNINDFRKLINQFYLKQELVDQYLLLLPKADVTAELCELSEELVDQISQLEPFGNGNPQPIIKSDNLTVINVRKMGVDGQHLKIEVKDKEGRALQLLAFSAPDIFFVKVGTKISAWYHLDVNEWQGQRTVMGRLLRIETLL